MQFIVYRTRQSSKDKEEVGTLKPALFTHHNSGGFVGSDLPEHWLSPFARIAFHSVNVTGVLQCRHS